jgi:hypothetical protein
LDKVSSSCVACDGDRGRVYLSQLKQMKLDTIRPLAQCWFEDTHITVRLRVCVEFGILLVSSRCSCYIEDEAFQRFRLLGFFKIKAY